MASKYLVFSVIISAAILLAAWPARAQVVDRKLVFSDEFNGVKGSAPDSSKWTPEIGGLGWGNKELEYYTRSTENTYQDGEGSLVIKAVKLGPEEKLNCWYGPCKYTSGRLKTKGIFEQTFGRFEARIKIPRGQGIWPAFWLLGSNIDEVGWPECGEIDIMENIGREPFTVHGTVHGPGYSGGNGIGAKHELAGKKPFADDYHIYAIEWTKKEIRWYVDQKLYRTVTTKDLPSATKWVFDHSFFVILNLAVGGDWPGSPDEKTSFPQAMMVDYVRVYELGN